MPFPPLPPFAMPFAPIAFFARLSSACWMCSFNVSARAMYSSIFWRISCLDFSFFSPRAPQLRDTATRGGADTYISARA